MGKSTKLISTGQGEAHAVGASVAAVQTLVHDPLGTIAYIWPTHWACHVNIAHAASERLTVIQDQIAQLAPNQSDIRIIADEALLVEAYDCGTSMVSNVVRSVRHLAQVMTAETGTPLTSTRAIDDIRAATDAVGISCHADHQGFEGLGEIVRVRDAIEHPDASNVYRGDDSTWDQVPLAWLLSDRSLKAYIRYREWFDAVAADWKSWLASRSQQTTLTVKRGMKSRYPAKRPKTGP